MDLDKNIKSPNFDPTGIKVEFIVIHYSAVDLAATLKILCDPISKVSAHMVISPLGKVFELVQCLDGICQRAWHAGQSKFFVDAREWTSFNDFSIGIELINLNGNFFPYSEAQYQALFELIAHLKQHYPALRSAQRIVGHEQISGFRGKCDPGRRFDWKKLFTSCYPNELAPLRCPQMGSFQLIPAFGSLVLARLIWGKNWSAKFNRQLESGSSKSNKIPSILLFVILIFVLIWFFV